MLNPALKRMAYSMLGSVCDAEDVLQDAQIKLLEQSPAPDNSTAFLFRVVTNLSIDRLRKRKRRQQQYLGPWLPEPLITPDSTEHLELAEQLSLGFVLMLERLSPSERCVFLLRTGFDHNFSEIGEMLNLKEASCRQIFKRAKEHLDGEERFSTTKDEQRSLLTRLAAAVQSGDTKELVQLLAPKSIALTDGGGIVKAAINPIEGARRIAQVFTFIAQKLEAEQGLSHRFVELNLGTALLLGTGTCVDSCIIVEGHNQLIDRIYVIRNPEKLSHLTI